MFIGHYAVALAAKKLAPRVSLGTLVLATQFVDLLWPIMLLLGLEHVRIDPGNTAFTPLDFYDYPITHSLVAAVGWSGVLGYAYFERRRYLIGAVVVGAGVLSHWALDLITHRPDLPLAPGSDIVLGLGLWNSPWGTIVAEAGLFVTGIVIYMRTTTAINRAGKYGLWSLLGFLALGWIGNMVGPPPPDETAVAVTTLGLWLLVPWAYWIDRNRTSAGG